METGMYRKQKEIGRAFTYTYTYMNTLYMPIENSESNLNTSEHTPHNSMFHEDKWQ